VHEDEREGAPVGLMERKEQSLEKPGDRTKAFWGKQLALRGSIQVRRMRILLSEEIMEDFFHSGLSAGIQRR